jgi:hypothetical protein
MTELLERVLSIATLRTMVRRRCRAGVSGRTISRLIASFLRAEEVASRDHPERLPVELIHPDRRVAFLEALQRLPASRTFVVGEIASSRRNNVSRRVFL